jgi:hypothetical protein
MKNKNTHTVGTVQKQPHCRNSSKTTTLTEQLKNNHTDGTDQKQPHCRNSSKTTTLSEHFKNNHTVGTVPKYNRIKEEKYRFSVSYI